MGYWRLLFSKAFKSAWVWVSFAGTVLTTVAHALLGDTATEQLIARFIILVFFTLLVFNLMVLTPYRLWEDERAKRETFEKTISRR